MRLLILFAVSMLADVYACSVCLSQEVRRGSVEIAIEPRAVVTIPVGSLKSIRGSVPCSNTFSPVLSVNPGLGLRLTWVVDQHELGSLPPLRLRGITVAAGWDDITSRFASSPAAAFNAFDPTSGEYVTVHTVHQADFILTSIRGAVGAEFTLGSTVLLRVGPSMAQSISGRSVESEVILEPSNARFVDQTQEREISEGTGDLEKSGIRIGFGAEIAFRLRLGDVLFIEPIVGADVGITAVEPSWSPLLIRGGISIGRWGKDIASRPAPSPPPPPPPIVEKPFDADLSIELLSGSEPITFRRQIVARYVPLLPMVFFRYNDSVLPEMYQRTGAFSDGDLVSDAERSHARTLDVFGERLSRRPRAHVTVTGTTSIDENNRVELARSRAMAVARYLEKRWGIERSRVAVRSQFDPLNPSNSANQEGLEENRRVELDFTDSDIYRPVQLRTAEPVTDPNSISFRIRALSQSTISRWEVIVNGDGRQIQQLTGTGAPPPIVEWTLSMDNRERIMASAATAYRLAVFDSIERTVAVEDLSLPLKVDTTVSVTSRDGQPDAKADFLLVTFDFDRAELTRRGREELRAILSRIGPESSVDVVGYTDRIGEAVHNRALALARAKNVAAQMPSGIPVTYRGASPDEAPYTSASPAGRFLSRTVRVVIENPR